MIKSQPGVAPLAVELSAQETKILRSHAANLDTGKYKNGKKYYMEYMGLVEHPEKLAKYLAEFEQSNYMNKMMMISSIKYYRDIKTLLIGSDTDPLALDPQDVIGKLDQVIEGNPASIKQRPSGEQKKVVKKQLYMTATKNAKPEQQRMFRTEHKTNSTNRLSRKVQTGNRADKEPNTTGIKQKKEKSEMQAPQREDSEESSVKYQTIDPSEYKYLKLIEIESKQNRKKPLVINTDRTHGLKADSQAGDRSATAISVRSYGKSTRLIKDLQGNTLYQKHHNASPKTPLTTKLSQKQNLQATRPSIEKKVSNLSASKPRRPAQQQSICNKIMMFIRSIFMPVQPAIPQMQKGISEQNKPLIKKYSSQGQKEWGRAGTGGRK